MNTNITLHNLRLAQRAVTLHTLENRTYIFVGSTLVTSFNSAAEAQQFVNLLS